MHQQETFDRALQAHRAAQFEEAERLYGEALGANPGNASILHHLGVVAYERGDYAAALSRSDAAIAADPVQAEAYGLRGLVLMALARPAEAVAEFERSIVRNMGVAEVHCYRGVALNDLGNFAKASSSFGRALHFNPDLADAYSGRGIARARLGEHDAALEDFDSALVRQPHHVGALNNRGALLLTLKRYGEALSDIEAAITHAPSDAAAHSNHASVLHRLGKDALALVSVDKALALNPDLADAHQNRAGILIALRRYEEAVLSAKRAVGLKPESADTRYALGAALEAAQRYEQAARSYEKAFAVNPGIRYLPGIIVYTRMHACLWDGFDERSRYVLTRISTGQPVAEAYSLLALPSSQAQQKKAAEMFVADTLPPAQPSWPAAARSETKIRLGYFSTDFRNHATAHLIAGLMESHDRAKFEVTGFAFTRGTQDAMRQRLSKAFDLIVDADDMADQDLVALARDMKIDIAIDLMGHNNGNRMSAFCHRLAPVQVTYLGYPGTTGAACMDYIVADPVVVPEVNQKDFAEKIAYLPHSYQINDSRRPVSDRVFSRAELGLPDRGFVFSCFNNNYKLTPDVFEIWMRLLKRVEGSVLWLLEGNADAVRNLQSEAEKHGVDPARLVFAQRLSSEDHLARHRAIDLVLDTFYYGAHTTASDALWSGVPVVTKLGVAFAGRVGASLLTAIGLPELITRTPEDYEALAFQLATDPGRLTALKQRLSDNRATHPLFDTKRFARNIEKAYLQMWERYLAGRASDHIRVRDDG